MRKIVIADALDTVDVKNNVSLVITEQESANFR
jgi:hypothetical protein